MPGFSRLPLCFWGSSTLWRASLLRCAFRPNAFPLCRHTTFRLPIHPLLDWGCCRLLAATTVLLWTLVHQHFVWGPAFIALGQTPRSGTAGSWKYNFATAILWHPPAVNQRVPVISLAWNTVFNAPEKDARKMHYPQGAERMNDCSKFLHYTQDIPISPMNNSFSVGHLSFCYSAV